MSFFAIVGKITDVEQIAAGRRVRVRRRLRKRYGGGLWRKMKGRTLVKLRSGEVCAAEVHWYEAHGIGRKDFKIKRFLS